MKIIPAMEFFSIFACQWTDDLLQFRVLSVFRQDTDYLIIFNCKELCYE